ncbi:MAG: hypothetical protein IT517_08290 [Burkholderiales bacterium]|nr:hypothetical protein [Burkholderiales bacterium]
MNTTTRKTFAFRLLALAWLLGALAGPPAWAAGGGTPDPSDIPVLQALRIQVDGLDQDFLAVAGIIDPQDLPVFRQLADELARIDAHLALAAVGGGTPDPSQTTLNQALLALRAEAVALHGHAGKVREKVAGNPALAQIATTLRYMQATARMLVARIDYALPGGTVPVPDL